MEVALSSTKSEGVGGKTNVRRGWEGEGKERQRMGKSQKKITFKGTKLAPV